MSQVGNRKELIAALAPFARLATFLDGQEFRNLYEITTGKGTARVSMDDLKRAQQAMGWDRIGNKR